MSRSGCFEIRMDCPKCGQSVPVNGPFRSLFCSSCLEFFSLPDDTITGFLEDFEEEYAGLSDGEGSGGTMMSGAGTFKYGYWRLSPRCSECGKPLEIPECPEETKITCQCGREYLVYPAPEWIEEQVPSARQFISTGREISRENPAGTTVNTDSEKPIVMNCPQCGGSLSVSSASERIMKCGFCESDVYIPDAVWARLHPVRKTEEWFAVFDGKTKKQILDEQRLIDEREQAEALKAWRPLRLRKLAGKRRFKWPLILLGAGTLFLLTGAVMYAAGASAEAIGNVIGIMSMVALAGAFLAITLGGTFYMEIAYRWGYPGKCRKAMEDLADSHGWKLSGREHRHYMGRISGKYRSCSFEIHPDDDYAIEVSLDDSGFYLKTEPPGYPPDDALRFTTGDQRFDSIFPIRFANQAIIKKLGMDQADILAPFNWFLDRWEGSLAKMKVDRSDLQAHLAPGHKEKIGVAVRFIYPGEIEPFLEDMITLARAIECIMVGKTPDLPVETKRLFQSTCSI